MLTRRFELTLHVHDNSRATHRLLESSTSGSWEWSVEKLQRISTKFTFAAAPVLAGMMNPLFQPAELPIPIQSPKVLGPTLSPHGLASGTQVTVGIASPSAMHPPGLGALTASSKFFSQANPYGIHTPKHVPILPLQETPTVPRLNLSFQSIPAESAAKLPPKEEQFEIGSEGGKSKFNPPSDSPSSSDGIPKLRPRKSPKVHIQQYKEKDLAFKAMPTAANVGDWMTMLVLQFEFVQIGPTKRQLFGSLRFGTCQSPALICRPAAMTSTSSMDSLPKLQRRC